MSLEKSVDCEQTVRGEWAVALHPRSVAVHNNFDRIEKDTDTESVQLDAAGTADIGSDGLGQAVHTADCLMSSHSQVLVDTVVVDTVDIADLDTAAIVDNGQLVDIAGSGTVLPSHRRYQRWQPQQIYCRF